MILSDYPKDIKAFYMRQNDDGKTVAAMDILFPGIGEIVGGSQREERLSLLEKECQRCTFLWKKWVGIWIPENTDLVHTLDLVLDSSVWFCL